ncbi:MAG TPA: HPr family phosphocarrier protein [Candidatus Omnitrophota bacterium]|mgnify:CR=1 FL=1|jgi:phosphotransferase system HPr (HPr) family protein|nr:HPr family phosphocarrier protein [Candidatus Omnitrophota bacterium]HSA31310.1 HPr family phosphocarrier protein [Candidatus Omnitrophota bacterium]
MPQISKDVVIRSPQGLHARPAALFVQIASKYDAQLTIAKDGETINGKSIMGILMLGAQQNSSIRLSAEGDDAEPMIKELEEFLTRHE